MFAKIFSKLGNKSATPTKQESKSESKLELNSNPELTKLISKIDDCIGMNKTSSGIPLAVVKMISGYASSTPPALKEAYYISNAYRMGNMDSVAIGKYLFSLFDKIDSTGACALNELTEFERNKLFVEWHDKLSAPIFIQLYFYFQPASKWNKEWMYLLSEVIGESKKCPRVYNVINIKGEVVKKTANYPELKDMLYKQNAHFNFEGLDFSECKEFSLQYRSIPRTNFKDVNLQGINLSFANFKESDFRGAKIKNANLFGADFQDAILDENVKVEILKFMQKLSVEYQPDIHKFLPMILYIKSKLLVEIDSSWVNKNESLVKLFIYSLPLIAAKSLSAANKYWTVIQTTFDNEIPDEYFKTFKKSLVTLRDHESAMLAERRRPFFQECEKACSVEPAVKSRLW